MAASTQGTEELLGEMTGSLDPNLGTNIDVQAKTEKTVRMLPSGFCMPIKKL